MCQSIVPPVAQIKHRHPRRTDGGSGRVDAAREFAVHLRAGDDELTCDIPVGPHGPKIRILAVHLRERIDAATEELLPRELERGTPDELVEQEARVLEVASRDGVEDCMLVREELVKRSDRRARGLGDGLGRRRLVAAVGEDARGGVEDAKRAFSAPLLRWHPPRWPRVFLKSTHVSTVLSAMVHRRA